MWAFYLRSNHQDAFVMPSFRMNPSEQATIYSLASALTVTGLYGTMPDFGDEEHTAA